MSGPKSMSVKLAGECMVTRPFSSGDEPEFTQVLEGLRSSDVTYAHVETNFGEYAEVGAPARSDSLGSYFLTDPRAAHDLRRAGVDLASLANNHSFDFGAPGILSTMRHCDAAGIAHAGTGRDLEEAREPAYLETRKGRVALVSVSSGNSAHEWATPPKATLPGRTGVNPLRTTMSYVVPEADARRLKEIWANLGIPLQRGGGVAQPTGPEFQLPMPGSTWGANRFVTGDHHEIRSALHRFDLAGNLRSVGEAATMADLVLVAHHFSNSEGTRGDVPPGFVREFAHACIDEGADIYVGHGWHKTLGIEIYKGRPIVYGIGNFFAQSEFARRVPFDGYESWGHDVENLPALTPASHPLHPGYSAHSATWWSSAVLDVRMEGGELREIRFQPVELGREVGGDATLRRGVGSGARPLTDGRPFAATGTDAERVLERYRELSSLFGTDIRIDGDTAVLK
ncbi:CapA family protein [Streptomyces sp. NPDC008150]|uniref:CapA family protein n=1 Tax=Streptomyces sp. NPDC008150 TaxID=3364816 RepID=UPI0036E29CF9